MDRLETVYRSPSPPEAWLHCFSTIGFLALFPIFALYHLAIAAGWITAAFGGLFSYSVIIVLSLFIPFLSVRVIVRRKIAVPRFAAAVGVLLVYCILWVVIHYAFADVRHVDLATEQSLQTIATWIALLLVGAFLPSELGTLRTLSSLALAVIVGTVLAAGISTGQTNVYFTDFFPERAGAASYAGIARSTLVLALLLLCTATAPLSRFIITVAAIVGLFLTGARSELVAFIMAACFLWLRWNIRSVRSLVYGILLLASILGGAVLLSEQIGGSRQLQLFSLSDANSWIARQMLMQQGVPVLLQSPIIGDFAWHISDDGNTGGYIHNILSAFMHYGLLGGALYFSVIISAFAISARQYFRSVYISDIWLMAFCVNTTSLLLILFSKPVFWVLPAFGWGLTVNAIWRDRQAQQQHKYKA